MTIVGESGIGKTAVLDEARRTIASEQPECRIVRLSGVEAEVELAWSGLAGLLDGLLAASTAWRRPGAAPSSPRSPWSRTDQPVEPFAIALATRDLLVDAAEGAPIVVFVDDLPWVDLPTRRTLSYIARRLQFERVAIVSTRRFGADEHTDTGPTLRIDAVSDDEAEPDPARRRGEQRRLSAASSVAAGGGIPLVLVEAANLLDADQRAGRAELPDPLPIGRTGAAGGRPGPRPARPRPCGPPCWSPPPSPTVTWCGSSRRSARADSACPSWRSPRQPASSPSTAIDCRSATR